MLGFTCLLNTGVADIDGFHLEVCCEDGLITRVDFLDASSIDSFRGSAQMAPHEPAATTAPTTAQAGILSTTDLSPARANSLQYQLKEALARWCEGDPEAFCDLPLAPAKTEFATEVRQALLATRPGELVTYRELARRAGRPKAIRAAASACARNPLPLLVPCHRVIPTARRTQSPDKTRDYGNYAYGRALKTALIEYERQAVARPALT